MTGKRQKTQYSLALEPKDRGETPVVEHPRAEPFVAEPAPESPAVTEQLMEEVCDGENLQSAWKRVRRNQGSPGVDGMTIDDAKTYLREQWPSIRSQLLDGTYQPHPVKRVEIPKPDGGVRKLGVPCVVDRLIQQAVLQVLQERWDPTFFEHSYGFRPGRSAHQAVAHAQRHVAEGYNVVGGECDADGVPGAYHAYDWAALSAPGMLQQVQTTLMQAQTTRNCTMREGDNGQVPECRDRRHLYARRFMRRARSSCRLQPGGTRRDGKGGARIPDDNVQTEQLTLGPRWSQPAHARLVPGRERSVGRGVRRPNAAPARERCIQGKHRSCIGQALGNWGYWSGGLKRPISTHSRPSVQISRVSGFQATTRVS